MFLGDRALTRRDLIRAGGLGLLLTVTGCDALSTNPAGTGGTPAAKASKQAPDLEQQVKAGKLPALAQRLPNPPMVVKPFVRVGTYGGTLSLPLMSAPNPVWMYRTIGYDGLVNWDESFTKPIPNIAQSFQSSNGGRVYTFKLRPGMRWSDGQPFNADDILFAYEDVLLNKDLQPTVPPFLVAGGQPAKLEKLDDWAVRFTFAAPNGMFLQNCATNQGSYFTAWPKHYMKQFHKTYNPDADALAKSQGQSTWAALFNAKGGSAGLTDAAHWQNVDLPVVNAWRVTVPPGKSDRVIATRNPYYWKVDTAGNQLPYLDQVAFITVGDPQVLVLSSSEGTFDLDTGYVNTDVNKPVLAGARSKGKFHFVNEPQDSCNDLQLNLNLSCNDPVLRKVFNNKDFRIGLSYAINRQEMIEAAFQRQGEPWQAAPLRGTPFFDETLAKQYTEHDVSKANQHLDKAGFTQKDGDGYRLGPDGKRISFAMETTDTGLTGTSPLELVQKYWKTVGVDMQIKSESKSLYYERFPANQHQAMAWPGGPGQRDALYTPTSYLPTATNALWAAGWALWYASQGKNGVEPPDACKEQLKLYDQLVAEPDAGKQLDLFKQILKIARDEFWVIAVAVSSKGYALVKNDLGNVPSSIPNSWTYPTPGPTRPEQFFHSS